jgi:hypothetical protein
MPSKMNKKRPKGPKHRRTNWVISHILHKSTNCKPLIHIVLNWITHKVYKALFFNLKANQASEKKHYPVEVCRVVIQTL